MQITVEAPDGVFCKGCDCVSYNYCNLTQSKPILQVYCRKLRIAWESNSLEVVKHTDCPTKIRLK